jgi:hypothetical protein
MIFPSVGDHGVHVLGGDLQHGGQTRGDDSDQAADPEYETAMRYPACSFILVANFRPVTAFASVAGCSDVEKSALVGNLTTCEQVQPRLEGRDDA